MGPSSKSLGAAFDSVTKYAVALTLAATCISVLTNIFLFALWGLPYTVAATTADIIIGAIDTFAMLLLPIAIYYHIAILTVILRKRLKFARILRRHPLKFYASTFLTLVATALIAGDIVGYLDLGWGIGVRDKYLWIFIPVSAAYFFSRLLIAEKFAELLLWRVGLLVAFAYLTAVAVIAKDRSPNLQLHSSKRNCIGIEYVVWAGSEYLVTTCDRPPFKQDGQYFIMPREGVILKMAPGKRNF